MPGRDISFINKGIYHIFNRTLDRSKIFQDDSLCHLFLDILKYYRSSKANLRFSNYKILTSDLKQHFDKQLAKKKYHLVELYCFSVMPTHFHLLLRQIMDGGVSHFISQVKNSFTHFFNLKYKHSGPLFVSPFHAVQVESQEQSIHTGRYIHLNHYSSGLITDINDLFRHPFSSLPRYMNLDKDDFIEKDYLLRIFNYNPLRYKKFVLDNADYQKSLERFKYIKKWI